jgi:hypothetical protein
LIARSPGLRFGLGARIGMIIGAVGSCYTTNDDVRDRGTAIR